MFALSRMLAPARACRPAALSYPLTSQFTRHSHFNAPSSQELQSKLGSAKERTGNRFKEFDMKDRVYAITGGARGIGLSMAEALLEAGAKGTTPLSYHKPTYQISI